MTPTSELLVELQKLRVTVGRIEGWDRSSIRLLQEYPDPVDAYRAALHNESALRSLPRAQDTTPEIAEMDPPDPVDAYRVAQRNESALRSSVGLQDSSESLTSSLDPMLSLEISRDRTLIGYIVGLGASLFTIWIIAMIMILVG